MARRALIVFSHILLAAGIVAAIIAWGLLFGSASMFVITVEDLSDNRSH